MQTPNIKAELATALVRLGMTAEEAVTIAMHPAADLALAATNDVAKVATQLHANPPMEETSIYDAIRLRAQQSRPAESPPLAKRLGMAR